MTIGWARHKSLLDCLPRPLFCLVGLCGVLAAPQSTLAKSDKKDSKFKVGARVMAQAGYRHKPDASVNAQRHRGELALRQARLKFRFKGGNWRMKASLDLADGISADGDRPYRFVRNAFAEWRPDKRTRVRLGNFKRPYSRLAWESANHTPTISRGLIYRYAVRRRNTNLAYGMRGLGVMVWHKFATPLGKARIYASVTQSELDLRSVSGHVLLRQAIGSSVEVDLYSTYKRSLVANEGVHSNASGLSTTVQLKGLYLLAELHAMQNWQLASKPWGLGILGMGAYTVWERKGTTLGPVLAVEWLNENLKGEGASSYRIAGGARANIQDRVGLWLQAQWQDAPGDPNTATAVSQGALRLQFQLSLSL